MYQKCNASLTDCRTKSAFIVVVFVFLSACNSTPLDLQQTFKLIAVTTGWLDVGLDDLGRNKIVPTISFSLENISDSDVRTLQVMGVFRRCETVVEVGDISFNEVSPADEMAGTCAGEITEWDNALVRAVGREGLNPGQNTGPITMESRLGYTGEQSRDEMLQHRQFIDAKVELFMKHRSDPWIKLTESPIDRQLLTQ